MRVMTVQQWEAQGVSLRSIRSLTRSGDLVRLRRGVYATRGALQWAGADQVRRHVLHLLAARVTVGRDAVASYHSAAVLHRIDLLRSPSVERVTLTVRPSRRWERTKASNLVFHAVDLPKEQVVTLYGLPLTTAARTVADLARALPFTDAVVADCALREEKATKAGIGRVLDGCARWPGVQRARRVLEFADERAESPLESAARVVFDQFGLDPPELQATVETPRAVFRVDFLWRGPGQRDPGLVAEADGQLKYNDRRDMVRQLGRDQLLRDAGFKVVHFTWAELFGGPEDVVARIHRAAAAVTPY